MRRVGGRWFIDSDVSRYEVDLLDDAAGSSENLVVENARLRADIKQHVSEMRAAQDAVTRLERDLRMKIALLEFKLVDVALGLDRQRAYSAALSCATSSLLKDLDNDR